MNYQKHYDLLIDRARNRTLEGYKEMHHVTPRCMGGTDDLYNIVELTSEEHYVAHQLLVKMYPDHDGLKWAAIQMLGHPNGNRNNNQTYGWLKKHYHNVCKKRKGKKNGSYGKSWFHNPLTEEVIKCSTNDVPDGFIKGRSISELRTCPNCAIDFRVAKSKKQTYCTNRCKSTNNIVSKETRNKIAESQRRYYQKIKHPHLGTILITNGDIVKRINNDAPIPEGWWKGRI